MLVPIGSAQQVPSAGPYKVLKTANVGGDGGFDYVHANAAGRQLYVPRSDPAGRITVFDLDALAPIGKIANANGHGIAVDSKFNHGFPTSRPIVMSDTKALAAIKTFDVQGHPDGILFDPLNQRLHDLSHSAPKVAVIDSTDGSIVGTIDLGEVPEQAVPDSFSILVEGK